MFKNMKMGSKIIGALGIVVTISLAVAGIGYYGIAKALSWQKEMAGNRLPAVHALLTLGKGQKEVLAGQRLLINRRIIDTQSRKSLYAEIDGAWKRIGEAWKDYEPLPKTNQEAEQWRAFVPLWEKWKESTGRVVDLSVDKDRLLASGLAPDNPKLKEIDDNAFHSAVEAEKASLAAEAGLSNLTDLIERETRREESRAFDSASSAKAGLIGGMACAMVVTLLLGFLLNRNVVGIVQSLLTETTGLVDAALAGNLGTRGNVDRINFEFRGIVEGMNRALDVVVGPLNVAARYLNRISKGDIPAKITDEYKGDFNEIKTSLNNCIDSINALMHDIDTLVQAALEGYLTTRANAAAHSGDYRKIVEGVNNTMNSVVAHLDCMPLPALIIGRDFTVRYVNGVGASLTGLSQQQIMGTKCYEHFQTPHCRTDKCATGQCMQRGHEVTAETEAYPQGRRFDISYTGVPVKDVQGKVLGALEIITDLTAVKDAARLADKRAEYQAAEVNNLHSAVRTAQFSVIPCK
jgi:methyl-accepting chemotaxis protein